MGKTTKHLYPRSSFVCIFRLAFSSASFIKVLIRISISSLGPSTFTTLNFPIM